MTRKLIVLTLILGGFGGVAFADDCPPGTGLRKIGTVASTASADTALSTAGAKIRASRVACTTTACRATLYDSDTLSDRLVNANIIDEPGAAASTAAWTEYDPPILAVEGITARLDANATGVLVFECR